MSPPWQSQAKRSQERGHRAGSRRRMNLHHSSSAPLQSDPHTVSGSRVLMPRRQLVSTKLESERWIWLLLKKAKAALWTEWDSPKTLYDLQIPWTPVRQQRRAAKHACSYLSPISSPAESIASRAKTFSSQIHDSSWLSWSGKPKQITQG